MHARCFLSGFALMTGLMLAACSSEPANDAAPSTGKEHPARQRLSDADSAAMARGDSLFAKAVEQPIGGLAIFIANQNLRQAMALYEKVATQTGDSLAWDQYISCYNRLGFNLAMLGKIDEARGYLEQALQMGRERFGENHLRVAASYNNFGALHFVKAEFEQAIEYYKKTLAIRQGLLDDDHLEIGRICSNLGITYYSGLGDFDLALTYLQRALAIFEKLPERIPLDEANIHTNLGIVYTDRMSYALARRHCAAAIAIWQKQWGGQNHPNLAIGYANLGKLEVSLKNYQQAEQYLQRSLQIFQATWPGDHPNVVFVHIQYAIACLEQDDIVQAEAHYRKALAMAERLFGPQHPEVGFCHTGLSQIYLKREQFAEALAETEKAFAALTRGTGRHNNNALPPMRDILSARNFHMALEAQGDVFVLWAYDTDDAAQQRELLQRAVACFQSGLALLDSIRISYQVESSKIFVGERFTLIYEKAIRSALMLQALDPASKAQQLAFAASEKARTSVLQQTLQEARARHFAGVPDSLLARETYLRQELSRYTTALLQPSPAARSSDKRNEIEKAHFNLSREYEALRRHFETAYPKYHALKYDTRTPTITDIQQELPPNTTLLEYFASDTALYLFTIDRDSLAVTTVEKDSQLEEQVHTFLALMQEQDYHSYVDLGFRLYQQLLVPVQERIAGRQLLIVPDGVLTLLPFEALLTAPVQTDRVDFQSLPYLLKSHTISYAYSASLWLETRQPQVPRPQHDLIAFAPVFRRGLPEGISDSTLLAQALRSDALRTAHGALPATRDEVTEIAALYYRSYGWFEGWRQRLFGSRVKTFVEGAATETRVKSANLRNYKIVHFATHGLANRVTPDLSWLRFHAPADGQEDGLLHLAEIYALQLDAELVVVSACETGTGQVSRGEGLLGLARGFIYAGARNLLVSLWQVPDQSTAYLMQRFYRHRLDGQSDAEALRTARLALITEDAISAMPSHWAPFVLIGQ